MPRPKWWLIARNEYLLKTSGIRRWRKIFPLMTVGLLAWYVMYAAPAMFSLASDLTMGLLLSEAALSFMQVMLFIIFISVFTIPIIQTLQDTNLAPLETLLSAPVRPLDVLLGKFLGMLPTYSILITVLAGTFLALFAVRDDPGPGAAVDSGVHTGGPHRPLARIADRGRAEGQAEPE